VAARKAAGCSWRVTTSSIEDRRRLSTNVEVLLTGHPEDSIDALVLEGGNEKIRSLHVRSPLYIQEPKSSTWSKAALR